MYLLTSNVRLSLAVVCLMLLLLTGCGGTASSLPAAGTAPEPVATASETVSAFPTELPVDCLQPWEQLTSAGHSAAPRAGSAAQGAAILVPGIEMFMESGHALALGEGVILASGESGDRELAYAIYRLPLAAQQPSTVFVDVNLQPTTGEAGEFHLAVAR